MISAIIILVGFLLYPCLVQAKNRKWTQFDGMKVAVGSDENREGESIESHEVADEVAVRLLAEQEASGTSAGIQKLV